MWPGSKGLVAGVSGVVIIVAASARVVTTAIVTAILGLQFGEGVGGLNKRSCIPFVYIAKILKIFELSKFLGHFFR